MAGAVLTVLTLVAVGCVRSMGVMERVSSYSCCHSPNISFDFQCEHIWSRNDVTIAWFKDKSYDCKSPCLKVEGGLMTLDQCVVVNVLTTCIKEMNVTWEESIQYHGQPCSSSGSNKMAPRNQGSFCVLLALLILGVFMRIC